MATICTRISACQKGVKIPNNHLPGTRVNQVQLITLCLLSTIGYVNNLFMPQTLILIKLWALRLITRHVKSRGRLYRVFPKEMFRI